MNRGKRTRTRLGWRWLTALGLAAPLLAGVMVSNTSAQTTGQPVDTSAKSALSKYARDITAAAEEGRFDSLTERQDEVERVIQTLSQQNNPVVLTDSQAIRDLVFAGVARRIVRNDIPEALIGRRLFKLDLDLLFRDSKTSAELVNKLSEILSDVSKSDSRIILLIDPIQSLIGTSAAFDGAVSALLRDEIRSGRVQCFGASTDVTFEQNVASDESLGPLFAAVELKEVAEAKGQPSDAVEKKNSTPEDFAGAKISSDLRELLDSGNAPERIKVILQVDDTNSVELRAILAGYGVTIDEQMAHLRTLVVDVPTKVVQELAAEKTTRHLSLDRRAIEF